MQNVPLTGAQLQKLQDVYDIKIEMEDGTVIMSRKSGKGLKTTTLAKMLHIPVQQHWTMHDGKIRNV